MISSNIAEEKGFELYEPAPPPVLCEFCGKTLYFNGLYNFWNGRIKTSKSDSLRVFRWATEPQRCDCADAIAKWEKHDAEIEKQKADEERQRKEKAHRERVTAALGESGIKKRFVSRTFENFISNTPQRKTAYQTAKDYADNFKQHLEAGEGLYIEGTFGTGKTHLAAAIALSLLEAEYNVVLKTADDLFRDIKKTFDESDGSEHKLLDKYKTCDLLVIDDIGKEQATDWTTAMLYAIINDRYERMKPIIVTTNFNEDELVAIESPKGVGSHRIRAILSRLHQTTATLAMVWQDWRNQ